MAILMTGLTGILGSAVGPALEEEVFFLVRGGKDRKNLSADRKKVFSGDILEPLCGVSDEDLRRLKSQDVNRVLHLAASVKFDENLSAEIFAINLTGTKNVLALAEKLGIKEFHYVSTAYASTGRNPYERSKQKAEELVKESGLKYSIYRPGVFVGDSRTGQIADFNGYYGVYVLFHFLARKIRAQGKMNDEVSLPVSVVCSSASTINLVPTDWVRDTILKLMRLGAKNEIYSLTQPNPPKSRWVMETGFRILGIRDIQYLERPIKVEHVDKKLRMIQEKVDAVLTRYVPYVTEEEQFSLETTRRALGENFTPPPEITAEFLSLLLNYAAEKNFGHERGSELRVPVFCKKTGIYPLFLQADKKFLFIL